MTKTLVTLTPLCIPKLSEEDLRVANITNDKKTIVRVKLILGIQLQRKQMKEF